ncbi:GNAT family N-acetyltransferase [Ferdinandcohnia quinoae]|uniref:GNAT family N-acetyltransferase n=1 Tax=Fredinandcohnia quinoae TaxID=2918902 RepID=A0AAW5E265_9BACI|nr:GNAT family N-acetyltransferase [Fredinandcohnia sp. SECRCQ15]MCH1627002.1 GNAT family N-acetyltransferase [Fredinandcohnia sp. SECRCQ15]
MSVVKITEDRYRESMRLSEYAFQYKILKEDIEKRLENMKNHQIFGVYEEDQLVAKLNLLSLHINIGERILKMGGIAGVATYPEFRRRGYVKEMLTDVLMKMRANGQTVSMLHPFSVSFYRKYGWELFSNRLKTSMKKADLVMHAAAPGTIKRYTENTPVQEVARVYEQYVRGFSGMLVRTEDWWENVIDDLNCAIYFDCDNSLKGYMLYSIKDSKMEVEEFIAVSSEARSGLWNFICQHDSMIDDLEIITYEKEPLLFSLENQKIKRELTPYFMVRIVDVEEFLKQYQFYNQARIVLEVTDPHAPWNEKSFSINDNEVTIVDSGDYPKVKLSINALSTILFGYKRPLELFQIGMITGDEEEIRKLENFIPQHNAYFYDFF